MPKDGKYYIIGKDYIHGGAVGWEFVNYHTVQSRWHGARPRAAWPDGDLQMPRGPWRRPEFASARSAGARPAISNVQTASFSCRPQ
jgi:hypothetical protein